MNEHTPFLSNFNVTKALLLSQKRDGQQNRLPAWNRNMKIFTWR